MYQSPTLSIWSGRNTPNGTELDHLWHHIVKELDLDENIANAKNKSVAILGFASDEGVNRNQGRTGAADGPKAIRKALCNLAMHFDEKELSILDAGDVIVANGMLEQGQMVLAEKVKLLLDHGYFPLLLGGGHEIAYGHFSGIRNHFAARNKQLGIVNLDAHFDLRKYDGGAHSGSPFLQIRDDCHKNGKAFHYFPIGINRASNTKGLFQVMSDAGQPYIELEEITQNNLPAIQQRIEGFLEPLDFVYLTLDLDVIAGSYAPGVSAPAPIGVSPDLVMALFRMFLNSGKVISMDLAEMNPKYDDGRTARLAAQFAHQLVSYMGE